MSLFDWFADRRKGQYVANVKQEPDEGDGLWSKCPECGQVVYVKDLKLNASVCANCGYHHRIDSAERIALIADPDSFQVLISHRLILWGLKIDGPTPIGCGRVRPRRGCGMAW